VRQPTSPRREEVLKVGANKNRIVQVRRAGPRKLFDKARKEVFLEWFAATCNLRLSAGKAGVHDKTVYKHLMKDEAFVEAFERALRLGYMRLEARQVQEAHRLTLSSEAPLAAGNGSYEVRCDLDDALVEEHFDPQLALQLLREHGRRLTPSQGSSQGRRKAGAPPQSATTREIADALAKRLKGFGLRVERECGKPAAAAKSRQKPRPRRRGGDER
jgi:hypothetical protein